nr:hypothetical protein [Tanacetum cinerariifolium]
NDKRFEATTTQMDRIWVISATNTNSPIDVHVDVKQRTGATTTQMDRIWFIQLYGVRLISDHCFKNGISHNQDEQKVVEPIMEVAVSKLPETEIDSQILSTFMEVDSVFNPTDVDDDVETLFELLHSKLPDLSFFHVFGAPCYPTNDSENLGKLQPKADIGIFIGYAPKKKAFRIYNRRTRRIVETIHVDFDELTAMASEQSSSGPTLNDMTLGTISSGLVRTSSFSTYVPPSTNDWDLLFQPMFDELLNPPPSVVN